MDTYYRLTYLNYKGRAELIRFILAYAEVDFEDCRIEPEEWPKYRPSEYIMCKVGGFCERGVIPIVH